MTKQKTYQEIVNQVQYALLTPEGLEKIKDRRKAAVKMARGLEALASSGWLLEANRRTLGSDRTVFTIRQGALQRAAKGLELSVELCGKGVGTLLPPSSGQDSPRFKTPNGVFEWRSSEALEYLRMRAREKKPSPERDVQGALVRAMFSSGKHDLLRNLQAVRPANCMMEIPAAVNARGTAGTGNIDILVRTGRGRYPTFVVCELKVDKTKPYDAMVQAIRYAAALDVEVNGVEHRLAPANRAIYRRLFGSKSTSEDALRFGAMAIIPDSRGVEEQARRALDTMNAKKEWLAVLLFERRKDGELIPTCRLDNRD